ncbi:hypothetical protein LguiA_007562 [Lonicera macranthoides]
MSYLSLLSHSRSQALTLPPLTSNPQPRHHGTSSQSLIQVVIKPWSPNHHIFLSIAMKSYSRCIEAVSPPPPLHSPRHLDPLRMGVPPLAIDKRGEEKKT